MATKTVEQTITKKVPEDCHPDDTEDVSVIDYGTVEVDLDSKILILNNGFVSAFCNLLKDNHETFNLRDPQADLSLFTNYPILIIPSGGLDGLSKSPLFKEKLKNYVEEGGTIICFTQEYGEDFSAIPGGISGYGWKEDQSCWSNAVSIANKHPIFSGQTKPILDANCDGYLTKWPDNAEILLNRTKNGFPSMLTYPYENGRVIVSVLYSDWGYARNHTSISEKTLIRDLITYTKSDRKIQGVKPGEEVIGHLSLVNIEEGADEVMIKVYDPNKNLLTAYSLPLTATFTFQTYATSTLGIYTVTYETQGTETPIFWFAVNKDISIGDYKVGDYQIWAVSSSDEMLKGSEVTYTVFLKNNTDKPIENKTIALCGHEQGGAWWRFYGSITPVNIPAKSIGSFIFKTTLNYPTSMYIGLLRDGSGPMNDSIAYYGSIVFCERDVWLARVQIEVDNIQTEGIWLPEEKLKARVFFKNPTDYNLPATTFPISVNDPRGITLFSTQTTISLSSQTSTSFLFSFTLPLNSSPGVYTISVGNHPFYFKIPFKEIAISHSFLSPIKQGTNTIVFQIENVEMIPTDSITLTYLFKDTEGKSHQSLVISHQSLNPKERATFTDTFVLPSIDFGTYTLNYTINYATNQPPLEGTKTYLADIITKNSFKRPFYRIRENLDATITFINPSKFEIEFEAEYRIQNSEFRIGTVTLASEGTTTFTISPYLPGTLSSGRYSLDILLSTLNSQLSTLNSFFIPDPIIELKPPKRGRDRRDNSCGYRE